MHMMYEYIAMIPARMGSKRIPKKNIRLMCGKPLIQYPIDLCLKSNRFKEIYLNTESDMLGKVGVEMGVKYHKRPEELATDTATNRDFTYEFLKKHVCDYVIMVNPTSPLLSQDTLNSFIQYVDSNSYDTVLSVINQKEETFFRDLPLNFSLEKKVNSQDLEPVQPIVWALSAWKRKTFIENQEKGINPIFGGNIGKFSIPKNESCDLDTEEDWKIAEGIMMSNKLDVEKRYLDD